jgi:anti-sigma-K factor RskA
MTHQELKDLLPLYVVGGLDAESIAEVESHLDTDCDSCPDELREWREVAGFIPLGATLDGPGAGVKERLLRRIRQEGNVAKVIPLRPRRSWATWVAFSLAAAAAILVAIGGLRYRELATVVTTQAQRIEELTTRTAEQTAKAETVASLLKQEQEKLASRDAEIQRLTASLAEQHSASTGKSQQVLTLEAALVEQQQRVATRERELARVKEQVAAAEQELAQMRRTSKERLEYATAATAAQREMQHLRLELAQAQEDVATHEREVRDMRGQMEQQRALVAASAHELDHLREAVTRQRGVIEVLTSPGVKIEYLRHAMPGLEAEGHVLWNERKKAWLFYAFGMPQPEQDKEYQVWFMTEKEGPVSAGVFMPDQSGTGQVLAAPPSKLFGKITAVAVTLEPKGGLPKPSGAMYLRGSL